MAKQDRPKVGEVYEVTAHEKAGNFKIPEELAESLGIVDGDIVDLHVWDAKTGEFINNRQDYRLTSGVEAYVQGIQPNQRIQVALTRRK